MDTQVLYIRECYGTTVGEWFRAKIEMSAEYKGKNNN